MRLYDPKSQSELSSVTLYLTPDEATELADTLNGLATDPAKHHSHVSSADYTREVTIAVYTRDNLSQFDAASRKLLKDEVIP